MRLSEELVRIVGMAGTMGKGDTMAEVIPVTPLVILEPREVEQPTSAELRMSFRIA